MKQLLTILMVIGLYSIQAQTWTQVGADFTGASPFELGDFHTVSMPDATTLAFGGMINDDNGTDAGKVWVYNWNGTTWIPKGNPIIGTTGDQAGPLDMPDVNTIAVGSPLASTGSLIEHGEVRIFSWNGSGWLSKGTTIQGAGAGDRIGYCVKMPSPNTVAIGSYYYSNYTGKVMVYDWNGTSWIQRGVDLIGAMNDDWFGTSLHMPDSLTLAVGSFANSYSGKVQIYEWNGTAWTPKGSDLNGGTNLETFGRSVHMPNANTIAVGADGFNSYTGVSMVYDWNGTDWIQRGDSLVGSTNSSTGNAVSMPDANTICVASLYDLTKVYNWNGTSWNQIGPNIQGNPRVVSMPDNNTVAMGTNGSISKVEVFQLSGATAIEELSTSLDMKLYPNPNTGVFVLSSAAVEDEAMIELYDMKGARLMQLSTTTKETIVDTGNTPAGLYLVKLIVDGKSAEQVVILR